MNITKIEVPYSDKIVAELMFLPIIFENSTFWFTNLYVMTKKDEYKKARCWS